MRVIVATRIYRPEPAAASLVLGAIADALTARGHEVEVYTVTPPKGLRSMPRAERVRGFPVLRDRQGYVRGYVQYAMRVAHPPLTREQALARWDAWRGPVSSEQIRAALLLLADAMDEEAQP